MPTVIEVANEAQLNQAIATVDELGATGDFVIRLTADIKLGTSIGASITYGGNVLSSPAELFALNLHNGVTVTIDGQGHKIDGSSSNGQYAYYRGLVVYSGYVVVQNLTIANTKATGGTGYDGGGGGAGLGGGLFVANDAAHGAAPGVVTLDGVIFLNNTAMGGGTVYSSAPHGTAGSGGGMGGIDGTSGSNGQGRSGGGGFGSTANGGGYGTDGGVGLILGAASGGAGAANGAQSGGAGGLYGGGGGGTSFTNTGQFVAESAGGGGGVGGAAATSLTVGGAGGFGGGGGEKAAGGFGGGGGEGGGGSDATVGGNGGFGGGGGGSSTQGGAGGFGAAAGSSTLHYSGGGGLGAGGAIFAQQGASITIKGASSISGGSVTAGNSGTATAGQAYGSGIFLQGDETITFSAAAGQTVTVSSDIADQSGSGGTGANAGVGSVVVSGAGTVVLSGNNTFTGGVSVGAGATFTGNPGSGGVIAGSGGTISASAVNGQGFVTNLGSGRLTLNGGTLTDAAGTSATLTNAITIGGTGGTVLPNGYYFSLTGGLTGSGPLTLGTSGGSGTVSLNADESAFTGSITVQSGTTLANAANTVISGQSALKLYGAAGLQMNGRDLAVGSLADGATGSGGYVQNASSTLATLTVGADGTDTIFSGAIGRSYGGGASDAIALRKIGAGTLTLRGADVLPGGLRIDDGAVQVGDGTSSLGSLKGDIVDNSRLFYATGAFNVTTSSAISGTGALTKLGTGVLVLSGASSLSGLTTVYAGTLAVDGSLAGSVTVAAGAVLAGHGTVGALYIQAGGRLAPGGNDGTTGLPSAYTLNTGSVSFGAGASWSEELNGYSAGTYDALNVTGTVNLNGVTLNLSTSNGYSSVGVGTTFTIITNDGTDAVVGGFANQNSSGDLLRTFTGVQGSSFYTYTQAYHVNTSGGDGNDVTLTMINTQPVLNPTASSVSVTGANFAFTSANSARITIADADEPYQQTLHTTITASHGTLTADQYFDGEGGSTLTLDGFSASSTNTHIGKLVYTPTPGFSGVDTLTITVKDSSGASNDTMVKTITINVTAQPNQPPMLTAGAASATLIEAGPTDPGVAASLVQLTASDPDGTTPTYVTTGLTSLGGGLFRAQGTYGQAVLNTANGQVAYALDNHSAATLSLAAGAHASDSFSFSVTDGMATASATAVFSVTGVSQNAVGTAGPDVFTSTGANNVIDGGAGVDTVVYSGASSNYARVLNANGSLTVTDLRSGSPDGTDTLINVERLQFTDRTLDLSHKTSTADVDFDGVSDVLFRNVNGTVAAWLSTVGPVQAGYTSYGGVSADWKIQGVGDFDGDGKADILWRNDSGEVGSWLSSHGANNANYTYMGAAGPEWRIQSVGDFDGDGKADILWRRADGDVGFWTSTKAFGGAGFTDIGVVSSDWKVQGSGDFDGDGKADVLWRNDNGEIGAWLSTKGAANANYTPLGAAGSDWKIVAVGDFDGDGKADILFMRDTTQAAYWLSGKGVGGAGYTDLGLVGSGWSVVGAGDYDGDGKADVLWRNTQTGEMGAWETTHGTGSASYVSFGVVPLDWQAYAPH